MTGPIHRVVLVGFMGAGKTTVGEAVARALDWRFADLDSEVEAACGLSVPQIFARDGEARFRELEAEVADALLRADDLVLATGGGWGAQPGRLASLPPGTRSVWLKVSPEEAVRRVETGGGGRPLLAGPGALERARALAEARAAAYAAADHEVDTDGRTRDDVRASVLGALLGSDTNSFNDRV